MAAADSPVTAKHALTEQLGGWAAQGIGRVKMKVGRDASVDLHRVGVARKAIGNDTELFVDANGGYTRKQALAMAERFAEDFQVTWFEEPRPSDDLSGLRLLRDRGPAGMDIAAGEYGDTPGYFRTYARGRGRSTVCKPTRRDAAVSPVFSRSLLFATAFQMPLSAHCAPQLHAHIGCRGRLIAARRIFPRSRSDCPPAVRWRARTL